MGYEFNVEKITEGAINWIRKWFEENGKDCKCSNISFLISAWILTPRICPQY